MRSEIVSAASITSGASFEKSAFLMRTRGPAMPTAATIRPSPLWIGAAMQRVPSSHSSSSMA